MSLLSSWLKNAILDPASPLPKPSWLTNAIFDLYESDIVTSECRIFSLKPILLPGIATAHCEARRLAATESLDGSPRALPTRTSGYFPQVVVFSGITCGRFPHVRVVRDERCGRGSGLSGALTRQTRDSEEVSSAKIVLKRLNCARK